MGISFKIWLRRVALTSIPIIALVSTVEAAPRGVSAISIRPAPDGGKYLTVHQSQTLTQWGFNAGMTLDYARKPLKYYNPPAGRVAGGIDNLITANFQGAIGWTDWFSSGVNIPLAIMEDYLQPYALTTNAQQKRYYGKMGDARLELKFRLLDIERYNVGLAIVPSMDFPTATFSTTFQGHAVTTYLGTGQWSPGATLALDGNIRDRVFLAFNVGYRFYKWGKYVNEIYNTNAWLDDLLTLGLGINVRIDDSWAVLGEVKSESVIRAFFKNQLQNPAEFLVGARFTPQSIVNGLGITLMGGREITKGVGSPDFRVLVGVNYRRVRKPEPPAPVAEPEAPRRVIIVQKIHFETGKATIRPISYPILANLAILLRNNPQIERVRIEGHTDSTGSEAFNQKLSLERADAVRARLIREGIDPLRLEAKGYVSSRPVAENNTAQGRALNRRTEFVIMP